MIPSWALLAGTLACVIVAGCEMSVQRRRGLGERIQPDGIEHPPRICERPELEREQPPSPASGVSPDRIRIPSAGGINAQPLYSDGRQKSASAR